MKIKDWQMWKDVRNLFKGQLELSKEVKTGNIFWLNIFMAIAQPIVAFIFIAVIAIQLGFSLFGVDYSYIENVLTDPYSYQMLEGALAGVVGTLLLFLLLLIAVSLFVGIFMPCANLNAFKIIVREKRHVSLGEYFGGMFKGCGRYIGYSILHIGLPIIGIAIVLGILDLLPMITCSYENIFASIFVVLYFRCCLKLFRVDNKGIMNKEWSHLVFFAIVGVLGTSLIGETITITILALLVEFDTSYLANKYCPEMYKNYNLDIHAMYAQAQEDKKEETKSENKPDDNRMMDKNLKFGEYEIKETISNGETKDIQIEEKEEPKEEVEEKKEEEKEEKEEKKEEKKED